ncbi:MAG: protein-L-isoaspartate O-methyltransferase [Pseudomonadota bacterium]
MDYEIARANMIEQQIRPWNVLALQTLNALNTVKREDFVPFDRRSQAFMDIQVPLPCDEVMLEPKLAARMMETLNLNQNDRVLEIGTGSGFLTALMATVCAYVDSVEIHPELHQQAQRNLGVAAIDNADLHVGEAEAGWGEAESYDAIVVTGSLPKMPESVLRGLKPAGRLVGIEGYEPAMEVVRYDRIGNDLQRESLFETVVPRLRNVAEPEEFSF